MNGPAIQRWEYRAFKFKPGGLLGGKLDAPAIENALNGLGMEGWEVVTAFGANLGDGATREVAILLKRPVRAV